MRRLVGAVGLVVVGLATAVAAVAVHTLWWGLPLVLATLACAMYAVGRGWLTRLPLAAGFVLGVLFAVLPQAEGGYVVSGGTSGWVLMAVALVVQVWAVVTLPRPGPARGAPSTR